MKFSVVAVLCFGALSQAFSFTEWLDKTIAHEGKPVGKEIDNKGCKSMHSRKHAGRLLT